MRRRFLWTLILSACLGCIGVQLDAANWIWQDGDTIADGTVVWADASNKLTITGDITIAGDVTIATTEGACHEFPVYIDADSFLHPTYTNTGHLVFYAGADSKILVHVDYDLIFTGSNWGDKHANNKELVMTFSGCGQTKFRIAGGQQVGFEGLFDDGAGSGWNKYFDDYTKTGSGTMVYISMCQTYSDAIINGKNQVVFERYYTYNAANDAKHDGSYYKTSTQDSVKISIGKNSFVTYISDNTTGMLANTSTATGFGSLAFDPSCYGRGRMLLHTKGSYWVNSSGTVTGVIDGYNDGALVVAGHLCADHQTFAGIRATELNKPAGVEAIIRVIDERAWLDTTYYKDSGNQTFLNAYNEPVLNGGAYDGEASRNGLLILCENKSIPMYASDKFRNNGWYKEYMFATQSKGSTSIRPGCILGANGKMELFHNTFLDYVASSTPKVNPFEIDQFDASLSTSIVQTHNPAAFTIDGLSRYNIANFDASNVLDSDRYLFPFTSVDANNGGRHAQILLRGDSRIYLRSGARNDGYIDSGINYTIPSGVGGYVYSTDSMYSFTINRNTTTDGTYDGSFIVGDATSLAPYYEQSGQGHAALAVEGQLSVRSTSDENQTNESGFLVCKLNRKELSPSGCLARHLPTLVSARGALNVPPIKIDHRGQEVRDTMLNRAVRPLTVDLYYPIYQSSSVFVNYDVATHNLNWHHNDVLKIATPEQDKAEAAIWGGEKSQYHSIYYSAVLTGTKELYVKNPIEDIQVSVPLISLFDSTVHCHESLISSGLRWVVSDKFIYDTADTEGDAFLKGNTSVIKCYNHGDPLDMLKRGYGRTFGLGTQLNKMANGTVPNAYTQNAYINVYRGWNTNAGVDTWGSLDKLVRLSLETDTQPKYIMQYEPRTFSLFTDNSVDQYKRVATQVIYLGNDSFASLGWTTTMPSQMFTLVDMETIVYAADGSYSYSFGINEGFRPRPWDSAWSSSVPLDLTGAVAAYSEFKYSLTSEENDPAELYINGDNFYFGGRDASGSPATEGVSAANESSIWYTNHGGKVHINQETLSPDQNHYYDCFIDTIFAYRPWPRILNGAGTQYIDGLSGIVDLPHDQVKFARSVQPYDVNFRTMLQAGDGQTKDKNVRLSVYDEKVYGDDPAKRHKASGEEVTLAWNFRTDKSVRIATMETSPTYTPVKSFAFMSEDMKGLLSAADLVDVRSTKTAQEIGAAEMPDAVFTVSTGDIITQLRVSGATKADPLHLYITGGHTGYGTVREITSLTSNYFNPGEGCHSSIFMDGGGRLGIGTRDWNEHSKNAWTVLGSDYLTIYPNGNCVVNLNSDVLIADRLPIIPTKNFGSINNDDQVLTFNSSEQRITFFSEKPREIRIPEGGELDLSAFGGLGSESYPVTYPQRIEFAGKVRLVFESGSKIRFPSSPTVEPVIYLNDEAEMVFLGTEDRDEQIWTDSTGSNAVRSKILGVGQIWLNKDAKLKIFDTALVGVETDEYTITTSLTISAQRQGQMLLGDGKVAGGGFQVGNIYDRSGSNIYFNLTLNGPEAAFSVERQAFFGLGAGTVNKFDAPDNNWRLQGLFNVEHVHLNVQKGFFNHSRIAATSDAESSLMALGPTTTYEVSLGNAEDAIIRGGGNMVYIVSTTDTYPSTGGADGMGKPTHTTAFAGTAPTVEGGSTGDYTIMASAPSIRQRSTVAYGTATVTQNVNYYGDLRGVYNYLGFPPHPIPGTTQIGTVPSTYVCLGELQGKLKIAYISPVTANNIVRKDAPLPPNDTRPEDSLRFGAYGATTDSTGALTMVTKCYLVV